MSTRFGSHDKTPLGSKQESPCRALGYYQHSYTDTDFVVTSFQLDINFRTPLNSILQVNGRHKIPEPVDSEGELKTIKYEGGFGRFDTPSPGLVKDRSGLQYIKFLAGGIWYGSYILSTSYYVSTITPSTIYPGWLNLSVQARGYTGHTLFNDFTPFGYNNVTQTNTPITCAIKFSYAFKDGLAFNAKTDVDTLWTCTRNISGRATLAP